MDIYKNASFVKIYVLQCLLEFICDKSSDETHKFYASEVKGLSYHDVCRSVGDLAKGWPMYIQLDPEKFVPVCWLVKSPTVKQMALALNIARTGGKCTNWVPDYNSGMAKADQYSESSDVVVS